jgi:ferredoxin
VFAVVTLGGFGISSALQELDQILQEHSHRGLDAGFGVKMPGNYVLMYSPPSEEKQKGILTAADKKISEIAGKISRTEPGKIPRSFFLRLLYNHIYIKRISRIHEADHQFTVSDRCTSCGTCAAICPADNIVILEGKPAWKHQCELCCGCIHVCPVQAIQAGKNTETRPRYRNPSVCVAELNQKQD